MKKSNLAGVASVLALAACAHAQTTQNRDAGTLTRADAAKCAGSQCTVAVKAANCAVAATPHYLIVTGKNVVLRWVIQDKGYTFPEKDGIFFKKVSARGAAAEFERCGRVNETTWQCIDKNSGPPMAYWYGVNVLKPDKAPCKTLDPTIINDMGEPIDGGGGG